MAVDALTDLILRPGPVPDSEFVHVAVKQLVVRPVGFPDVVLSSGHIRQGSRIAVGAHQVAVYVELHAIVSGYDRDVVPFPPLGPAALLDLVLTPVPAADFEDDARAGLVVLHHECVALTAEVENP